MSRFSVCRWISAYDPDEVERFIEAHRGDIARDLDNYRFFGTARFRPARRGRALEGDPLRRHQGLSGARQGGLSDKAVHDFAELFSRFEVFVLRASEPETRFALFRERL